MEKTSDTIRVAVLHPGQTTEVVSVENTLEAMQSLVGGYIEPVILDRNGLIAVCNEEGKLMGLPANRVIHGEFASDVLVGSFFVCRDGGEDFDSIREEDEKRLLAWRPAKGWNIRTGSPS